MARDNSPDYEEEEFSVEKVVDKRIGKKKNYLKKLILRSRSRLILIINAMVNFS